MKRISREGWIDRWLRSGARATSATLMTTICVVGVSTPVSAQQKITIDCAAVTSITGPSDATVYPHGGTFQVTIATIGGCNAGGAGAALSGSGASFVGYVGTTQDGGNHCGKPVSDTWTIWFQPQLVTPGEGWKFVERTVTWSAYSNGAGGAWCIGDDGIFYEFVNAGGDQSGKVTQKKYPPPPRISTGGGGVRG